MYFIKKKVKELVGKLAGAFKGAEMLLEALPASLVKKSEKQDQETISNGSSVPLGN